MWTLFVCLLSFFFFQAEDGIRDRTVTGVQTCALPILGERLEEVEVPPIDERHLDRGTPKLQDGLEAAEAASDYNDTVHDRRSGIGDDVRVPIPLMLATLTARRDFGDDWLLERKFDGERCVARKVDDAVRLESRTGKELTGTYPEVRAAVVSQRARDLQP